MGKAALGLLLLPLLVLSPMARAEEAPKPSVKDTSVPQKDENVDFKREDTFIDVSDALRSKQYVHRAILNSLVKETNKFAVGHFYISHMMGFTQVWQRGDNYSKYASGLQGLSLGYLSPWGHALEVGGELSSVTTAFLAYRYYIRFENFSLWPFVGGGVGTEITSVGFAEGPPEAGTYTGMTQMGFASLGVLVPTIDIGFKGEVKLSFYGPDRFIFTTGVGVILFL